MTLFELGRGQKSQLSEIAWNQEKIYLKMQNLSEFNRNRLGVAINCAKYKPKKYNKNGKRSMLCFVSGEGHWGKVK